MQVSAREFKSSQGKYLKKVREGQDVFLKSRFGYFKISVIPELSSSAVDLTTDIVEGLRDIRKIKDGKMTAKSARTLLDEL